MTTTQSLTELSTALAEQELALEATRSERMLGSGSLIKNASLAFVEKQVRVLEPYYTFEGTRRYRPVWRTRLFVFSL